MIGGGRKPEPGELSLAHNGVLFLDEFGEFNPAVIDAMRQPVEEGVVRITRSFEEMIFPAQVLVVAAANPCKCGNLWDEKKRCTCTTRQIESYTRKLRGPFSDRIDMHIKMTPVDKKLLDNQEWQTANVSSDEMREMVIRARDVQDKRYQGTIYKNNGNLDEKGIKEFCVLDDECRTMLNEAYDKYGLSLRAYNKVIKVSRTLADMEESADIQVCHVAEALLYRVDDERN
jgi:magnesium chelatase family protein